MKIRMKVYISGTRDGVDWPPVGAVMEVPDEEGAELCAAGFAGPVADKDAKVEKAVLEEETETRSGLTTDKGPRRGPGRPPGSKNRPKAE